MHILIMVQVDVGDVHIKEPLSLLGGMISLCKVWLFAYLSNISVSSSIHVDQIISHAARKASTNMLGAKCYPLNNFRDGACYHFL